MEKPKSKREFSWAYSLLLGAVTTVLALTIGMGEKSIGAEQKDQKLNTSKVKNGVTMSDKVSKTDEEWRKILTPEQYRVLREKGTERAFSGEFYEHKVKGNYLCAACGEELFGSETKYESGCGWPSFYAPSSENIIDETTDNSLAMSRTEITCSKCDSHLGHVFNDGPNPTGLRYCVNSASLKFRAGSTDKKIDNKTEKNK